MTDKDVVMCAATLMAEIGGRQLRIRERELPSGKYVFTTILTGLPAIKVMQAVFPYMGDRRAARITELVENWSPKKYKEAVQYKATLQKEGDAAWPSQE
jgi:hypothetical protein